MFTKYTTTSIRHLVLDGPSQWIAGQNVTLHCSTTQMGARYLEIPEAQNTTARLLLAALAKPVYLDRLLFLDSSNGPSSSKLAAHAAESTSLDWAAGSRIIDKVHSHICSKSLLSDFRTLLLQNKLWCLDASQYLSNCLTSCHACRATSKPKQSQKVPSSFLIVGSIRSFLWTIFSS